MPVAPEGRRREGSGERDSWSPARGKNPEARCIAAEHRRRNRRETADCQAYASDREISMAATLSIVDCALDLGQYKRRPLQIGMALANARLERA